MDVRDAMPRSVLTTAQQRRLAALQAAKGIQGAPSTSEHVRLIIEMARYIECGW
jgi:hypothetical protein